MSEKILFVDDEPHVLQSIKRQFRKRFTLQTAEGGEEALRVLKEEGPFAVIVSDMRMPGMNGVELLSKVKDLYPETVRLMLTGNADQQTAMDAVNTGHIFRFLTKPCPPATFVTSLALAQRQYRLITAEKEVLQKTLKGSIEVLSELLSIANPLAFSAGLRIKNTVLTLAEKLELPNLWQYEIAALMAQIGCVTLPSEILSKIYSGKPLEETEQIMFNTHPETGAQLLEKIPRLENITRMIALQQMNYAEYTSEKLKEEYEEVIAGAQILKIAIEFDIQKYRGVQRSEIIKFLSKKSNSFNPTIVSLMGNLKIEVENTTVSLPVSGIAPGMIAADDIYAKNGILVMPKGQTITQPLLQGLKNFAQQVGIDEPVRVTVTEDSDES